jgi:hypothetical protein
MQTQEIDEASYGHHQVALGQSHKPSDRLYAARIHLPHTTRLYTPTVTAAMPNHAGIFIFSHCSSRCRACCSYLPSAPWAAALHEFDASSMPLNVGGLLGHQSLQKQVQQPWHERFQGSTAVNGAALAVSSPGSACCRVQAACMMDLQMPLYGTVHHREGGTKGSVACQTQSTFFACC